ncbi:MAG TPA: discoidin domain-containing protein, partial [Candidatus Saccharimonadales bacterium]|nr:discoidin domain-containing protein [Candidatus Saccharimonadales bacterium]
MKRLILSTQKRKALTAGLLVAGIFICTGLLLFSLVPGRGGHDHQLGMLKASAAAYVQSAVELPRTGWTATASDQYGTYVAKNVLDGETTTFWHSTYTATTVSPLPHSITIDMKATKQIAGLTYLPRQDTYNNGNIGRYTISVSSDGTSWGTPVTTGTWSDTKVKKDAAFNPVNARYVRLTALSEAGNRNQWSSAAEINIMAGVIAPPALPRAGWTATASDSYGNNPASYALDGNATSIWHSAYTASGVTALPHSVTIDMKAAKSIAGLSYLPRQDTSRNGTIGGYSVSVSTDGTTWGSPVATGTWADTPTEKTVVFNRVTARYVRLTATTEAGNRGKWSSAAEISVRGDVPGIATGGKWDNPIGFPLVPTSAVLLANNKLLTFSAYADNGFNRTTALTRVAIMDLT